MKGCPMLERTPAWLLAVVAMLSVQFGAAVSVYLFDDVGVAPTASAPAGEAL